MDIELGDFFNECQLEKHLWSGALGQSPGGMGDKSLKFKTGFYCFAHDI